MTKRVFILALSVAILAALSVGVTSAYMFKKTEAVNVLEPGVVSCKVTELLDGQPLSSGMQEGNRKQEIRVQNTGNVKAYIRVRIVSYWVDASGNVVGLPSEMPAIELLEGWTRGADDAYYYASAVDPEAFTGILCVPFDLKTENDANDQTVYQAVDLVAEAIQAEPASAAADAWKRFGS